MGASEESMEQPLLAERGISSSPSALPKSSSTDSLTGVVVASTFVAVLGSYEFGSSIGFSSPAQSGIMADLGLSLAQYSVFGSIVTMGAMLGAIMSGRIADFMGRRGVMGISDIFCIAGWIIIFCSKGFWGLILGRLSVGFGIGLLSYVVPVYIAEITSKNLRGGFITMHQFMICCGSSIAFVMGTFLSWRTLALLGATPCLLQSVGLFFIPESPRWLAKIDHYEEFESALQSLRGKNVDISLEADEIMECTRSLQLLPKARILDLFQRRYLHSVIVGVGIMVLQQFSGVNGVIYYASALFVLSGFSSGYIGSIAMAAVQIPMTALGVLLIDKTGRRPLLMVSAAGTCLGCILVGISFLLQENEWWKALTPVLTLTGILVYTGSFSFAMAGIPWVIMSEIFPMNMKGSAGSLVALVNWFGTGIISYVFNFLISWSAVGTFFIFAGFCGITILFVVKLVPETKGKTLEEIQDSMMLFSLE